MLALSPAALGWSRLKPHHSDVMMIEPAVASEVWPSEANFELGPQVVSYDVPFAWRHTVPTAQPDVRVFFCSFASWLVSTFVRTTTTSSSSS